MTNAHLSADFLSDFSFPLHHAYCVVGETEQAFPRIERSLERELGFPVKGNPDFWRGEYETFGIDEARQLKEASTRHALGARKVFILAARGLTSEAQNALLKTFEEPAANTIFFLVVPSAEILLPTVRSRLQFVFVEPDSDANGAREAEQFLAETVPARLARMQAMLAALEKEKDEKEDSDEPLREKARIFAFLDAVERAAAQKIKTHPEALEEILGVKKYMRDRAPSLKLLLEHLALVLPRME